ncbi:MAG: peptidoglycan-associated lipoprotein Pal [Betaproteobacteria bacterium]|nr:MAG: peptidoglycan-associated lipoprotein Pal [Betaproteobacteria bacterium]
MKRYLIAVITTAFLAACSSTPTKEQDAAAVEDRGGAAASQQQQPPRTTGPTTTPLEPKGVSGNPLKDPANILSKRSVYFELDSNIVKEEFKPMVSAHARYLQQNRGVKMTVQGHADERGSREYNLALGQRRADAVKQMMQLLGAQSEQVETISFGEEKPKATGHDEKSWAENRRADLVYPND